MLKRVRLAELLEQIAVESELFATDANGSDTLPPTFIGREKVYAAAQYLHELGLTAESRVLAASYNAAFNASMDVRLSDLARGKSAKYQHRLQETFGPYPRPADDETTHQELQQDRRCGVLGRVSLMADYVRQIRKCVTSQSLPVAASDHVPQPAKRHVSTFGDLVDAVAAEITNIEFAESGEETQRAYNYIESRCYELGGEKTAALNRLRDQVCSDHGITSKDADRRDLAEFARLLRHEPDDGNAERNQGIDDKFAFLRDGDGYQIEGFGEQGHFSETRGLKVLDRLLRNARQPVLMRELVVSDPPPPSQDGLHRDDQDRSDDRDPGHAEGLQVFNPSPQEALDQQAIDEIRKRVADLNAEIDAAREAHDWKKADNLKEEKEKLRSHMEASLRLGGRPRDINNPVAPLRTRIAGQLRTVYQKLEKASLTKTRDHLKRYVRAEGSAYIYDPPDPPPWLFERKKFG